MLEKSKEYIKKDIDDFIKKEVKELQKIINYHSDLYYNKENPIISDFEYDELFKRLTLLEKKFNIKNKETKKVGSNVIESSFLKVPHSRPMISLDNTYNEEDLNDFNNRIKKIIKDDSELMYTLEFKFDGLGIELIYKDGVLKQAITRGDGVKGEDVTQNIMQIENIPKTISYKKDLEVRGEVVLPISVFEELNNKAKLEGTKIFSNPRNAAAGSIRMKDNSITKERRLKFFAYDLANFREFSEVEEKRYYYDVIKDLETFGFEISSYFIKLDGITEVIKAIENFGDIKKTIDFEIDGLVLKINDLDIWKIVGSTEHHPRYAIAYKFPAEIVTTKIIGVDHQVGKTGTITPVANLEEVNINGAIIRRSTLHNYLEVKNLDARVGDSVFIKRAGEVIPKIISVIKEGRIKGAKKINPPKVCPSCGTLVLKDEDKVRYYCPNKAECLAQNAEKLVFAVGKQGFNIDGLGDKQIKTFLKEGIISNLADIFKLEEKREEMLELEGFKEKSVNNLIESVNKAKTQNIVSFLTALGINAVGKKTSKTLAKIFENKEDLINFKYSIEDLLELEDFGPETSESVLEFFTNDGKKKLLYELLEIINIKFLEKTETNEGKFAGKRFCITGSFEGYSRDQIVEIIEKEGGEFIGSVSKKLDFLIAGEKAGSKIKKAEALGVEVVGIEVIN